MKHIKTTTTPSTRLLATMTGDDEMTHGTSYASAAAAAAILIQAADAAMEMLPALEKEYHVMRKEMESMETSISRLKTVIGAAMPYREGASGPPSETEVAAGRDIDNVLASNPKQPLSVTMIRSMIRQTHNRDWAPSTVSNYLSRGKSKGIYLNEGGMWSFSDRGLADYAL